MSEPTSAFSTLEARVNALSNKDPLDRISLRDHTVEVEIGAFQVERNVTQRVVFNIIVELMPAPKDLCDDVDLILSYDTLTEAVQTELAAERLNLLETLAERIADRILLEPKAVRVFVRIEKLDRGPGALGVEIVRTVADQAVVDDAEQLGGQLDPQLSSAPRPRIIYLSYEAQQSSTLGAWIEAASQSPAPIVFALDMNSANAAEDMPDDTHGEALSTQRHIDLLQLEQNAWRLAAQDARCHVRGSRTELDWALKQGAMSIWAPFKMVLDAVDGPAGNGAIGDAKALTLWLAHELNACEVVLLDADQLSKDMPAKDLPQGDHIPIRTLDPNGAVALF